VYANLGYIAIQRGRDAEAEQLLRRAIGLDAKLFPPRYDLGRLLFRLKKYEEAVEALRAAAALNEKDPGVHYQLFLAYSRLRRKTDAERELAEFKRLEEARKGGGEVARPPAEMPTPAPER
jgi:Flp pilus assembly protein TadD